MLGMVSRHAGPWVQSQQTYHAQAPMLLFYAGLVGYNRIRSVDDAALSNLLGTEAS
jgi:hypothetical protein